MNEIKLRVRHFTGDLNQFQFSGSCPVAMAVKEMFPAAVVAEGVFDVMVNKVRYGHEFYSVREFSEDFKKLRGKEEDEVIRIINFIDGK